MDSPNFENQGFDPKHSAVVPLAYLDKLLKCYYGAGPRDGENVPVAFTPSSPAVEVQAPVEQEKVDFREAFVRSSYPSGYEPKGAAARRLKGKRAGEQKEADDS